MHDQIAYMPFCLCIAFVNVALISHAGGKFDLNYANKVQHFSGILTIAEFKLTSYPTGFHFCRNLKRVHKPLRG